MMPVYVFIKTMTPQETSYAGTFAGANDGEVLFPVGVLPGYDGEDQAAMAMLERDLQVKGSFVAAGMRDKRGYLGVIFAASVIVEEYDIAKDLPGFVPLFSATGFYALPPS
jgi:hypothetical protein